MTYDEFLDNEKKRGVKVYRCRMEGCKFRGIGASTFYHEMYHPNHQTINEDTLKKIESIDNHHD